MVRSIVALVMAASLVGIAGTNSANAGLFGSNVTATPLFPDLAHIGGVGHAAGPVTVGPGIEFPDGTLFFGSGVDITDTQIIFFPTISTTYLTAPFNGGELDFSGAPPITSVTPDPLSTIAATGISFSADQVFLNFSGQTVVVGEAAIFDVNRAPEPATLALLGLGLAGLGFVRRRRAA